MNSTRIATRCARCDEALRIKLPMVGKQVRCSACRDVFVVKDVFFSGQLTGHLAWELDDPRAGPEQPGPQAAEPAASSAGLAALLEAEQVAAVPAARSTGSTRRVQRRRWPRMLAINLTISAITALAVWIVSGTLTNYAIVRWTVDDTLLEDRFQFLVDDQPVDLHKSVTEQRLKPGQHTLAVVDDGKELQRSEFTVTAKEILTYHVHTEKITIEGGR